jgi:very-short-patch-repair endonuclease
MRKNATNAERRMWSKLRDGRLGGLKFLRQVPIGRAIADFVCYEHNLIVEVDGGQHSENRRDLVRNAELCRGGFHVLRFWKIDVMRNTSGVLATILAAAKEATRQ